MTAFRLLVAAVLLLSCCLPASAGERRDERREKHGKPHKVVKPPENSMTGRRYERTKIKLEPYGAERPEELEEHAREFLREGAEEAAIRRYLTIRTFFPDYRADEDLLVTVAGLQYRNRHPVDALRTLETFGERYPESPRITQLVDLSWELGQDFVFPPSKDFRRPFRLSKALRAFEFVKTHDPYSMEAARSLYSMASINMKRREWEDASLALKEIETRQPSTDIAADAEVALAECDLGMNKGGCYSRELLDQAVRTLTDYLRRHPDGARRVRAEELLAEARKRVGVGEMAVIRFYCSQRKWTCAKRQLAAVLADQDLAAFHGEAGDLLAAVERKSGRP